MTEPVETPTAIRMAAAHRAVVAGRNAGRAAKVPALFVPTDGTHALITGYTAARAVLTEAIADLDVALAALKTLRKAELAAAAEESPNNEERPAGATADRSDPS